MSAVRSKVRLYDLAKDLKVDTKRLITEVRAHGVDISVPSNSISKALADKIRDKYSPKRTNRSKREIKRLDKSFEGPLPAATTSKTSTTRPRIETIQFKGPLPKRNPHGLRSPNTARNDSYREGGTDKRENGKWLPSANSRHMCPRCSAPNESKKELSVHLLKIHGLVLKGTELVAPPFRLVYTPAKRPAPLPRSAKPLPRSA